MIAANKHEVAITRGHVIPYVAWIGAIMALVLLERIVALPPLADVYIYALKTLVCAFLLVWWKPWRLYQPLCARQLLPALLTGIAVAVFWVLPESAWLGARWPAAQLFYHRWLIMMPGALPDYYDPAIFPQLPAAYGGVLYDPTICGWPLTLMRVFGSVMVIALVEELFFRGFLYRWLQQSRYWQIPLTQWNGVCFWAVVAAFGFEHDRWLAGLLAGLGYGLLTLRTGSIWAAALAHAVTNGLLAFYVIRYGRYGFW